MLNYKIFSCSLIFILLVLFSANGVSAQPYQITQTNITNGGGGPASGGLFQISGTTGQPLAVTDGSTGGQLILRAGFFTPAPFGPTAALVSAGGRVLNLNGSGISQATVSLMDVNGVVRTVPTNPFGYYQFTGLAVGQIYVFSVTSKEFQFDQSTQVILVSENLSNINFTAVP